MIDPTNYEHTIPPDQDTHTLICPFCHAVARINRKKAADTIAVKWQQAPEEEGDGQG